MPDPHRHTGPVRRWLFAVTAFLVLGAVPALALSDGVPEQPSLDLVAQLERLQSLLTGAETAPQSNAALIEAAGLAALVRPSDFATGQFADLRPVQGRPAQMTSFNMRLALTLLSQAFGTEDNFAVLAAQTSPDMAAMVVALGDATLADLRQAAGTGGTDALLLTQPLIIMAGASLTLGPQDVLHLSRGDGAFVVNFGHLQINGGTIAGQGEANPAARSFVPFVTTTDAGTVAVQGGQISGLGFGDTLKFAGFAVMRSVLQIPQRPTRIENADISGLMSLAISGETNALLRGNRFHDMRGASLTLSRTGGARVLSNLFFGRMPTNAIRLENGSAHGLIAGNIVLGGDRAGIAIRFDSPGARVANNIVWGRDGGGITLNDADCGQIYQNLIIDNDQKGIEVRFSRSADLALNTIYSNDSAGIWISDQPEGARTTLTGNVVGFNGAGIAGANTALIVMDGNDFSDQYQQFLSGDLALQTATVARNMTGQAPFTLVSGGQVATGAESETMTCTN